jgi:hypothetical protein
MPSVSVSGAGSGSRFARSGGFASASLEFDDDGGRAISIGASARAGAGLSRDAQPTTAIAAKRANRARRARMIRLESSSAMAEESSFGRRTSARNHGVNGQGEKPGMHICLPFWQLGRACWSPVSEQQSISGAPPHVSRIVGTRWHNLRHSPRFHDQSVPG